MTPDKVKKSKTETIKDRLIYVYLPSETMYSQWRDKAEKSGMTLSKYVVEHVNNSIQQEQNKESYVSRLELLEARNKILEENKELYKKIKTLESLVDRLEEENRKYRIKPFLEEDFSGIRKYEDDLIKLFKSRLEVRKEEVLKHLNINPMDTDSVKWITKQIENLEHYGLVKDIGGKLRWKG